VDRNELPDQCRGRWVINGSTGGALLLTSLFQQYNRPCYEVSMRGWQIPEYFNILDFKRLQQQLTQESLFALMYGRLASFMLAGLPASA